MERDGPGEGQGVRERPGGGGGWRRLTPPEEGEGAEGEGTEMEETRPAIAPTATGSLEMDQSAGWNTATRSVVGRLLDLDRSTRARWAA